MNLFSWNFVGTLFFFFFIKNDIHTGGVGEMANIIYFRIFIA